MTRYHHTGESNNAEPGRKSQSKRTAVGIRIAIVVAAIGIIGVTIMMQGSKTESYTVISVDQAKELIAKDTSILLLDVRTEAEFEGESGHLANALLIPVQELAARIQELETHKEKTIVAYCRSGNRSGKAAELLAKHGFTAMNVAGGMLAWNERGYPVVRGK